MNPFTAHIKALGGELLVHAAVDDVFPLFSPQGERLWAPDWDPEMLHPGEDEWRQGQVFRTQEEMGEAVWIITRLDRTHHTVEYHRVEPGRYVAHIVVRCRESSGQATRVSTSYSFVGLSKNGNRDIAAMTQEAYDVKMSRWSKWIHQHLTSDRGQQADA